MDSRKISVCIPTYNRVDLVIRAIQGVILDPRVDEIIISDDNSTDDSFAILTALFSTVNKIKLSRNTKNLDCYRNKHQAISLASNEWCILFDSDNVLSNAYIDALFKIGIWDPKTIYQPSFAKPHFDFRLFNNTTLTYYNIKDYLHTNIETALNAMNFFINRDEYLKVWDGSVDPVTSDSIYFNYCWLKAKNRIHITPGLEYEHTVHNGHYQTNLHRTPKGFHQDIIIKLMNLHLTTTHEIEKTPIEKFNIEDCYTGYVNLEHRPDRKLHMAKELERVGISATLHKGVLPIEVQKILPNDKLQIMLRRSPGAVGCWYSQTEVMRTAQSRGQHAWVMEDDLIYCDDLPKRLEIVSDFLSNNSWDIMWLGGTWHSNPTWHKLIGHRHAHIDMQFCECRLNKDWEPTPNNNIVRTYGCWSTYSYIVNKNSISKVLDLLDQNMYRSQGIDHCMIYLQPKLFTYAFTPGCCKQIDNKSDIGNGITRFSVFENLGEYWFKQTL